MTGESHPQVGDVGRFRLPGAASENAQAQLGVVHALLDSSPDGAAEWDLYVRYRGAAGELDVCIVSTENFEQYPEGLSEAVRLGLLDSGDAPKDWSG